jgi:hypothetical protein
MFSWAKNKSKFFWIHWRVRTTICGRSPKKPSFQILLKKNPLTTLCRKSTQFLSGWKTARYVMFALLNRKRHSIMTICHAPKSVKGFGKQVICSSIIQLGENSFEFACIPIYLQSFDINALFLSNNFLLMSRSCHFDRDTQLTNLVSNFEYLLLLTEAKFWNLGHLQGIIRVT